MLFSFYKRPSEKASEALLYTQILMRGKFDLNSKWCLANSSFSCSLTALATPEGSVITPLIMVIQGNKVTGLQSEKQTCHNSRQLRCRLRSCPCWSFHHQLVMAGITFKVSIKVSLGFYLSYYKKKKSRKRCFFLLCSFHGLVEDSDTLPSREHTLRALLQWM